MAISKGVLETKCLSTLTKVFADEELSDQSYERGSALLNETYSFQVAYCSPKLVKSISVTVESEISEWITIRTVGLVPSEFPIQDDHDEHILRSTPGLYPDPLYPIGSEGLTAFPRQWRSVWVTVALQEKVKSGIYPITVKFSTESGELIGQETFKLEVIPALLPEQSLIHTEWFHTDCLATYYNIDIFSEEHWKRIEQFVQTAVNHGMNMILTPLFTPPLDTEVGGERPTVQLVDIEKSGDSYRFNFDILKRWIDLCRNIGIKYFEYSHFFTQWGAKHAPKIVCIENGELRQIFGWETEAAGHDYRNFLSQFLPELVHFIEDNELEHHSYFHVSDEPSMEHLESYRQASEFIREYLNDYPIIDALSDYTFYEKGLVKNPIPANNHINKFLENKVENLWTYYCVSQYRDVSNRFFCLPSSRNRIIGMQLYKYKITGFLHWGFNFWYSSFSRRSIDPFKNTDAYYSFPSGDPFLVYPGENGPIESIRLEVFYEALQDLRAMQLLESYVGKEKVVDLLEDGLKQEITFSRYPTDQEWLLSKREQVNVKIKEFIENKEE